VETNDSSLYLVRWIHNSDKASLSINSPGDYVKKVALKRSGQTHAVSATALSFDLPWESQL
jgi:hypothetical protein